MTLRRSIPLCLSRSFTTSSRCKNSTASVEPSPPRRRGRIPPPDPKSESLLPPDKLRALVSLYHQSDDFITMENLERRIDEAFTAPYNKKVLSHDQIRHGDYTKLLQSRRDLPRIAPWSPDAPFLRNTVAGASWSEGMTSRERMVVDALCGVETTSLKGRTLPGYETLLEMREKKKTQNQNYSSDDKGSLY